MRVTVCQMRDQGGKMQEDWLDLVAHSKEEHADLIVLPEMPFSPWFAAEKPFDQATWDAAVEAHDAYMGRLAELSTGLVVGTRPVNLDGKRLNEGFVWSPEEGYRAVHHKFYLPDEDAFWEASWYERSSGHFKAFELAGEKAGMMICTEMWFTRHAHDFGRNGVNLLISPRATLGGSTEKWVAGGVAAAVVSGAYSLASNRGGVDERGLEWGGNGWIIEPEEGQVLARTSLEQPIITMDLDMAVAEKAKTTYPRYVKI